MYLIVNEYWVSMITKLLMQKGRIIGELINLLKYKTKGYWFSDLGVKF